MHTRIKGAASTASSIVFACVAPSATSGSARAGVLFHTVVRAPDRTSARANAEPIEPSPITLISTTEFLPSHGRLETVGPEPAPGRFRVTHWISALAEVYIRADAWVAAHQRLRTPDWRAGPQPSFHKLLRRRRRSIAVAKGLQFSPPR